MHPSQLRKSQVRHTIISEVLVNFVHNRKHIPLFAQLRNKLKLCLREHLAGRIVGSVDKDQARPHVKCARKFLRIEVPRRWLQRNAAHNPAGHHHARRITIVIGLKHNHFVARINKRLHRRKDSLGSAAHHSHLVAAINLLPIKSQRVLRNRGAQIRLPVRHGILVVAAAQSFKRCGLHFQRAVKIWKALRKIDGSTLACQQRHLSKN